MSNSINLAKYKVSFFKTRVNVFQPLNTVGKLSLFNVVGVFAPSLERDEYVS